MIPTATARRSAGGGLSGLGGSRLGGGGLGDSSSGATGTFGVLGVRRRGDAAAFGFDYAPLGPRGSLMPSDSDGRGFRIHPVGRGDSDRPASRGLRIAFVAAGAVSLAALALGGMTGGAPTDADSRGTGSSVLPARTQGTTATPATDGQRRRGGAPSSRQGRAAPSAGPTPSPRRRRRSSRAPWHRRSTRPSGTRSPHR
ncbi:hypothetical protein GCM10020256_25260 [Streptomyces thermocoprophilus]